MFFVRCTDNSIVFIFKGEDELDEDWENDPLTIPEQERSRAILKIVGDPETKDVILVQFDGEEIPVS